MSSNETFGMSIEKTICDIFNLQNDINNKRTDKNIINELKPKLKNYLKDNKIILTEYIGSCGHQDDFLLENGKYLQVKTNYNNSEKVCPPKIGQCTKRTFLLNIAKKINPDIILLDNKDIKEFIFNNIKQILIIYINAYYTSDIILYVKKFKNKDYLLTIYDKINLDIRKLDTCEFKFTRNPENWNESSTLKIKYNNKQYSIGEFQIHKNRNNIKFRFIRNNFHKFIDNIHNQN